MEPSGHVCPTDIVEGLPVLLGLTRLQGMTWRLLLRDRDRRQKRLVKICRCIAARCGAHGVVDVRALGSEKVPRRSLKLPGPELAVNTSLAHEFATPLRSQLLHELVGPEGYKLGMAYRARRNRTAVVSVGQGKEDAVGSAIRRKHHRMHNIATSASPL